MCIRDRDPKCIKINTWVRYIRTNRPNSGPIETAGVDLPKTIVRSSFGDRYRPFRPKMFISSTRKMKKSHFFRFVRTNHPANVANSNCIVSARVDLGRPRSHFGQSSHILIIPTENVHFQHSETPKNILFRTLSNLSRHGSIGNGTKLAKAAKIIIFSLTF